MVNKILTWLNTKYWSVRFTIFFKYRKVKNFITLW